MGREKKFFVAIPRGRKNTSYLHFTTTTERTSDIWLVHMRTMECSWMAYKDLVCGRWLVNFTLYWLWLLAMNGLSREKISRKMARIMPLGMMVADGNAKFMQHETEDHRLHNISKFAWISMCKNYLRQFGLIVEKSTQIYRIEYWICKWFKLPVEVTKAMWWKKKTACFTGAFPSPRKNTGLFSLHPR